MTKTFDTGEQLRAMAEFGASQIARLRAKGLGQATVWPRRSSRLKTYATATAIADSGFVIAGWSAGRTNSRGGLTTND